MERMVCFKRVNEGKTDASLRMEQPSVNRHGTAKVGLSPRTHFACRLRQQRA